MTVKILLIWLEKQIQRKFRTHPSSFPVCKSNGIRMAPANQEFSHIDLLMPLAFKELVNRGKSRDLNQEIDLDSIEGFPTYLIDFCTYLKGGQSGPLSGSGSDPPEKVGARALKIKKVMADNLIPPMSQGAKRKYDCLTSGSRQFEMTTKKLATWKPTAENRPVLLVFGSTK